MCVGRGDVFLYNTALWHSSGINTSPHPRYAILSGWTRSWLSRMPGKRPPKPEVVARAEANGVENVDAIFGRPKPGPGSTAESLAEGAAEELLQHAGGDVGKAKALLDAVSARL